jgi:hypothetical protein
MPIEIEFEAVVETLKDYFESLLRDLNPRPNRAEFSPAIYCLPLPEKYML